MEEENEGRPMEKQYCDAQNQSGYWKGRRCGNADLLAEIKIDDSDEVFYLCPVHYGLFVSGRLKEFEKINGRWKGTVLK